VVVPCACSLALQPLTEQSLRDHPSLVKAFMGISADQFWELIEQMTERFATYLQQQRAHPNRQRAVGAG